MITRRGFVKLAGAGALATTLPVSQSQATPVNVAVTAQSFNIAVAGYTFLAYNNNLEKIIEVMNAVGVKYISLKNFQLPYDCSKQQADEVIGKFTAAGIQVYGLGVISLKTQPDVDNVMNYAQRAGVKMIIVSPAYEVLSYLEKQAKANNIRVAIHNHGPEDKIFPDIDAIYEKIKSMDPVMGICLDIGHTFRCGHDPAAMLLKYKERIYDVHVKDIDAPVEKGQNVVNGRGKINFMAFAKALSKSGYSGMCSLEFEQKGDPAIGLAESVGYFKGVLSSVK